MSQHLQNYWKVYSRENSTAGYVFVGLYKASANIISARLELAERLSISWLDILIS